MSTTALTPDIGTVSGLAARAAARREELGLTQAELAKRIGKSREWVLRFEHGNPGANLQGVLAVLHELGISLSEQVEAPRARTKAIASHRKAAPTVRGTVAPASSLVSRPAFVVADSLSTLHGPASGEVSLPKRILWNPSRPFDLSNDKRAATLLRLVLQEAKKREDLEELIDPALLKRLWGRVRLPSYIREGWESKFPELAEAREHANA